MKRFETYSTNPHRGVLKDFLPGSSKTLSGFTLVELLVVISIIALLLAVLLPSLQKARQQGQSVICKTNLRTIGLAERLYADTYNGYLAATRGDRPGQTTSGYYGFYWAAQLWSIFNHVRIPESTEINLRPPVELRDWLYCPTEKKSTGAVFTARTWGDVHMVNNTAWLQNICYARNWEAGAWVQDGKIDPPYRKIANIMHASEVAANADSHFIHFPGERLYTDKYLADGRLAKPYNYGGLLCVKYRHGSKADRLNVLLWDGHVGFAVNSIADKYGLKPLGDR